MERNNVSENKKPFNLKKIAEEVKMSDEAKKAEALKKKAEYGDDEANLEYDDPNREGQQEREFGQYGISTQQAPLESTGFTQADFENFESAAISGGFDDRKIRKLKQFAQMVSDQLNEGVIKYKDAMRYVFDWIKQQSTVKPETAKPSAVITNQPETFTQNMSEEEEGFPPLSESDFEGVNEIDDVTQEAPFIPPEEEAASSVAKEGDLPTALPEDYNKQQDKLNKAYEQTHGVIDPNSQIFATKQSEAFENKFLRSDEEKWSENFRQQAINVIGRIRKAAIKAGKNPPNLNVQEVAGAVWTNVHNALGLSERVKGQIGIAKVLTDNRLAVFAYDPELVPDDARGEWSQVENEWNAVLQQEQKVAIDYNNKLFASVGVSDLEGYLAKNGVQRVEELPAGVAKPKRVPERLYANRKSTHFIEKNPALVKKLIVQLNRIINEGPNGPLGQKLADAVLKRAGSMAAHEITNREADKSRQFNTVSTGEGEELDVTQQVSQEDINKRIEEKEKGVKGTVEDNQKDLKIKSGIIKGFMTDVWGGLEKSVNEFPDEKSKSEHWKGLERVLLKMAIFDYQSNLFSNTPPDQYSQKGINVSGNAGLYNDFGQVNFSKSDDDGYKEMTYIDKETKQPVNFKYYTGMKDMVSQQGFFKGYMDLLELKTDILKGVSGGSDIESVKQQILSSKPKFDNPIYKRFLADPQFIKMTLKQNYEDILGEVKKFQEDPIGATNNNITMYYIVPKIAADVLVAIAKRTEAAKENPPKTPEEATIFNEDFLKARQSFLSVMTLNAGLTSEVHRKKYQKELEKQKADPSYVPQIPPQVSPSPGKDKRLATLLTSGLGKPLEEIEQVQPIDHRNVIMMIAGAKPIPPEWIPVLAGKKYQEASRAYDNMIFRIAKLEALQQKLNKFAASESAIQNISDKISEVREAGMAEIARIFRK